MEIIRTPSGSQTLSDSRLGSAADEWFRRLEPVHDVLKERLGTRQTKVAIIDTGVDHTHAEITQSIESGRIFAGMGFPSDLDPFEDVHGHGTYAASVFLKTAPNALLCIARICETEEKFKSSNDYYQWVADVHILPRYSSLLTDTGDTMGRSRAESRYYFTFLGLPKSFRHSHLNR